MIVVGVDFSEGAAAAAMVALGMAEDRGETVRFVHVCAVRESGEGAATAWHERLDLPGAVEIRTGVPWVELVRAAGGERASFLVAGTHGMTGSQPLRLGTTAGLIALRSPIPVVLVPRPRPVSTEAGAATTDSFNEER